MPFSQTRDLRDRHPYTLSHFLLIDAEPFTSLPKFLVIHPAGIA